MADNVEHDWLKMDDPDWYEGTIAADGAEADVGLLAPIDDVFAWLDSLWTGSPPPASNAGKASA